MSWRWLQAKWTLGIALILRLFRPGHLRHGGAKRWLRSVTAEGLGATPADAWGQFAGAGRCIGCGFCDAVAGDISDIILCAARRPEDAFLAEQAARRLRDAAQTVAQVCPTRVALADVASLIEANARNLRQSE